MKMLRRVGLELLSEKVSLRLTNYVRELRAPRTSIVLHVNTPYIDGRIEKEVVQFRNIIDISERLGDLFKFLTEKKGEISLANVLPRDVGEKLEEYIRAGKIRAYKTVYNFLWVIVFMSINILFMWMGYYKSRLIELFGAFGINLFALGMYAIYLLSFFKTVFQFIHYIVILEPNDNLVYREFMLRPKIWSIRIYHVFIPYKVEVTPEVRNMINTLAMTIEEVGKLTYVFDYITTKIAVLKAQQIMLKKQIEDLKVVTAESIDTATYISKKAVSTIRDMRKLLIEKEEEKIKRTLIRGEVVKYLVIFGIIIGVLLIIRLLIV